MTPRRINVYFLLAIPLMGASSLIPGSPVSEKWRLTPPDVSQYASLRRFAREVFHWFYKKSGVSAQFPI